MLSTLRRFSLWLALVALSPPFVPGHATVNSSVNKTIILGNGAQTQFTFNFIGVATAYIGAIYTDANGNETVLTQGTGTSQYQVVLNPSPQGGLWGIGGTVTYDPNGTPIANGTTLTIFRTLPLTQAISLQNQISLSALGKGSETGLDTLEMQLQQISEMFNRAVVAPIVDSPSVNLTLPAAGQRANEIMCFDSLGNVAACSVLPSGLVSSVMQPVVDASSLAAGRAAFGLGSMATENINGGNCGGASIQDDGSASGANGVGYARVVAATVSDATNQAVLCNFHLTQRIATGPITYTLPRANTLFNGFGFWINALPNTGAITLTPNPNDSITTYSFGVSVTLPAASTYFVTTDAGGGGKWYISASPTITNAPPHLTRLSAVQTTFTPDVGAKMLDVQIVGGGGGGSGNGARNVIGYNQYGGVGVPSGIGGLNATVTISQASPAVVTWNGHGLGCNDPVYFTTTGSLPAPLVANQLYYIMCDGSVTSNTFEISSTIFDVPLTCAVYAPRCQVAINTSSAGSGTQTGNAYEYVAFGGYGGGIDGDQANPGSYRGCDANGPAGYVQSYGITGTTGENVYIYPGYAIEGSRGGGTPLGGGMTGSAPGIVGTGGGGSGALATTVSASGGSGGGAGYCHIWLQPNGPMPILCGTGGAAGIQQNDPVTISIASPAVITFNNHGFFGGSNPATTCSAIQFTTTGTLPTGISPNTPYFVINTGLNTNTFEISNLCGGSAINTSGSQSGTQSVISGGAGGAGGAGACYITQYFR
jgi:hypothetical protein